MVHGLRHTDHLRDPPGQGQLPHQPRGGCVEPGPTQDSFGISTDQVPDTWGPWNFGEYLAHCDIIIPETYTSWTRSLQKWRNQRWIGDAQPVGGRTRPSPRNVRAAASSGRMDAILLTRPKRRHQVHPGVHVESNKHLHGTTLDGVQSRHGILQHGDKIIKMVRRLAVDDVVRRQKEHTRNRRKGAPRRSHPTRRQLQNHRGIRNILGTSQRPVEEKKLMRPRRTLCCWPLRSRRRTLRFRHKFNTLWQKIQLLRRLPRG